MNSRTRGTERIFLGVYTACALILLSLPINPWVAALKTVLIYCFLPPPYSAARAAGHFSEIPSNFARLLRVDQENQRLARESMDHEVAESQRKALIEENERLKSLLGIRPSLPWRHSWAKVVGRDMKGWNSLVWIDRGSDQGAAFNAPVLGTAQGKVGVLGRVVEVLPDASKVLLMSDELSALTVVVGEGRWEGLLEGSPSAFKVRYLPVAAKIGVGDEVWTSPSSLTFPPGILVGKVEKILPVDSYLPYREIQVRPAVHPGQVSHVLVLSPHKAVVPEERQGGLSP